MSTVHTNSILTGKPLRPLITFGDIYVSDFLKEGESPKSPPCPLRFGLDEETGLVQLMEQPDAELMWGSMYWYRSGTNQSMIEALSDVAEKTLDCIKVNSRGLPPIFLDIASNDGTLLKSVKERRPDIVTVGIDPSDYPECTKNMDLAIKEYFSFDAYAKHVMCSTGGHVPAQYITCCAMFYDLDQPLEFLKHVRAVLDQNGVFVLQLSYTPLMLIQSEIGNAVHEHLAYYTAKSLEYALSKSGFVVRDADLNNVNGGSVRIYCQRTDSDENSFRTRADRDIGKMNWRALLAYEAVAGCNTAHKWQVFYEQIRSLKKQTINFLEQAKKDGKKVWGYGASTKGNTLLQLFGIDNTLIEKIAEKQEVKHGLRTVGSNIPICSEEEMREVHPDYLFVLPWHFIKTFSERERQYLEKGGKFIVPCPEFKIIGIQDV